MADIGVDAGAWSSTAGSNQPTGATNIGTGLDDNLRAIQAGVKATLEALSSVAGTNTITATMVGLTAYYTGLRASFVPANTNTGATTLNITSLGAKNVFWNGVACVGGEIRQNIPVTVIYDGTQFHVIANGFNAPFLDTHPVIVGGTDSTKKVRFEVDGLTTATTRVATMPDKDGTVAMTSDVPTVSAKAGSFTRDVSTASGNQAVTGVGFVPRAIVLFADVDSGSRASWGVDDGTNHKGFYDNHNDAANTWGNLSNASILLNTGGGASYSGLVTSLDADGFTIAWTKTGSPTGTANINYVAWR